MVKIIWKSLHIYKENTTYQNKHKNMAKERACYTASTEISEVMGSDSS